MRPLRVLLVLLLVCRLPCAEHGHRGRTVVHPGRPGIGDPYFPLEGNGGYDVAALRPDLLL